MHKTTKISSDEFSRTYAYRGVEIDSVDGANKKFSFRIGQVRGYKSGQGHHTIGFNRMSDAKNFIDKEFDN